MSQLIYNDLKQMIHEVVGSNTPTDFLEGTIAQLDPIKVEIDGNSEFYSSSAFMVPEYLTDREVEIEIPDTYTGKATIKNALKVGDKVLIVQCQKGQTLIILDRLQQ